MNSIRKDYFLYLGPGAPEKVSWAERPAYGGIVVQHGSLSETAALQGEKVVVLVPGVEVLLTAVLIPGRRGRIIKKSISYALEETLAEDIENLHFAHGPVAGAGEIPVAVVAKTRMEAWLAMLNEFGLDPEQIVPTTLAVPLTTGQESIVLTADQFIWRQDHWHGYAGDLASLPVYLPAESGGEPAEQPDIRLYVDADCGLNCEDTVAGLKIAERHQQPLLQVLAAGYDQKKSINLLQGDYGRHAGWRDLWQKWQMVIMATILLLIVHTVVFSFDFFSLKSENVKLDAQLNAIYLGSFPDSRRIVNARAQMEQKLVELQKGKGGQSEFFAIYDKTLPLLMASAGFSLDNLRFNNGRFDYDFAIKDLEALEKLKRDLVNLDGLAIEIKNAKASNNLVKAKIQIKSR